MANLMTKKLAKLPIGTYLELSYGDSSHRNTISGIITDSDSPKIYKSPQKQVMNPSLRCPLFYR